MPLASLFSLAFYGPAAAAARSTDAAGSVSAGIKGFASPDATLTGIGAVPNADATRLRNRPATITGTGSVVTALPKGRARPTATIKVNALSQDDVTGAILEAPIEGGLTLRQALRLIAAATAGKVSGADTTTITIRSAVADSKDRIVATVDGSGNRSAITYDLT